ncbi:hypothetical protein ACPZ19_04955 [Amycolatopsis lurida]
MINFNTAFVEPEIIHGDARVDTSAASVPGAVLDPFGSTGTTTVAALRSRRAISLDASRDYCRLATWRVHDPRQQARARGTH